MKLAAPVNHLTQLAFIFLLLFAHFAAQAQTPEIFVIEQKANGDILIKVNLASDNSSADLPEIKLYEVLKSGETVKTARRTPTKLEITKTPENFYEILLTPPAASTGFIKFEADVSNYKSGGDQLNFRASVLPAVRAQILSANRRTIILRFFVPKTVTSGCQNARGWIIEAFRAEAGSVFKFTSSSNDREEIKITGVKVYDALGANSPVVDTCTIQADLTLENKLPVAESLDPATIVFAQSFINSDTTLNKYPYFAALRDGIKGSVKTNAGLNEAEKRDDERKVVFEFGGGLTTTKQKENVTDPEKDRETSGFFDLRIALPTKFKYSGQSTEYVSWWQWTPAQFDAMISEGDLLTKNLTTNTMRLFTQAQFVKATNKVNTDFIVLNFDGGAAADRDLRVIDYTVGADFRWEPAFLNRTYGKSETGKTPATFFEISPVGFEIGGRQERKEPFFPGTDSFIRRYRFSGRFELQLPPYAQIILDNRSWYRWEAPERKFRNYFKSTLNIFPRPLSDNFSAGVFLSYERGSLPPFSTSPTATFKVGFRVRRRQW